MVVDILALSIGGPNENRTHHLVHAPKKRGNLILGAFLSKNRQNQQKDLEI